MRLHEEFKLWETLWEAKKPAVVIFVGDTRANKQTAKNKAADYENAVIVDSLQSFMREYDISYKDKVDFYVDSKGMEELREFCAELPYGDKILQAVTELK